MINKKALNLEMLKIAGFTCTGGIWTYPDGVDVDNGVPFFPDSLDECVEWLLPPSLVGVHFFRSEPLWICKLELLPDTPKSYSVGSTSEPFYKISLGEAKTHALAFCLAMRELK